MKAFLWRSGISQLRFTGSTSKKKEGNRVTKTEPETQTPTKPTKVDPRVRTGVQSRRTGGETEQRRRSGAALLLHSVLICPHGAVHRVRLRLLRFTPPHH